MMKRLLSILLSLLLVVVPVMASAETSNVVTFSDIVITQGETTYDFTGLELTGVTGFLMNGIAGMLDVSLDNTSLLTAGISMDDTALTAGISGMSNAFSISLNDAMTMAEAALAESGIDMDQLLGMLNGDMSGMMSFSEEAMAAFEETMNNIVAEVSANAEMTDNSMTFVVTSDELVAGLSALADVLSSNEMINGYINEALGEMGGDVSLSDIFTLAGMQLAPEATLTVIYGEENTQIAAKFSVAGEFDDEGNVLSYNSILLNVTIAPTETAQVVDAELYLPGEADMLWLHIELGQLTEAGDTGLFVMLDQCGGEDYEDYTDIFSLMINGYADEDLGIENGYSAILTLGSEMSIVGMFGHENGYDALSLTMTDAYDNNASIAYYGTYDENGTVGTLAASIPMILSFSTTITCYTVEDFTVSFDGMEIKNLLDGDTMSEENMEVYQQELMGILMNAMSALSERFPFLADQMGIQG